MTPDDDVIATQDPDLISDALMIIDLDKIGFEYGDCEDESITGEIKWFEI